MGRSNYSDEFDTEWQLIMYRGAVASAIRGKRGQAFLKEMLAALDKMEPKRLIANDLVREGEACAIGTVALARGMDVSHIDIEEPERVARAFGISTALAAEIEYENDQDFSYKNDETPEQRYERMRRWVVANIRDK